MCQPVSRLDIWNNIDYATLFSHPIKIHLGLSKTNKQNIRPMSEN